MRTNLRRTVRQSLATAAAATLLVGLTACAGDEPSGEAGADTTSTASETTGDEPDATADAEESEDPADGGDDVSSGEEISTEDFLADFQEGVENSTTAHMSMNTAMGGMDMVAEGDVDYQTDPPSMALTMTIPAMGGEIDMRFVDGIFYMNMGEQSQGKFIKMDPDDPNSPMGDVSELTDTMDPVGQFEEFTKGVTKVVYVGEEDIDGDSTEHYVLTLDTTKIESMKDAGAAGIPQELDYDMWLDDDNRIRRMKLDMGASGQVEVQITDWDEPVEIEAPPADQIMEMPQS